MENLKPTFYIDSDSEQVSTFADKVCTELSRDNQTEITKALFNFIRDEFSYYPFQIDLRKEALKASSQLTKKHGYCVSKAILLVACLRYKKIPARLCFFNVKNHLGTGKLEQALNTDLIVFHGGSEVYLNQKWIKLVPAFDKNLCEKLGVEVLKFDGENDAIFQEYNSSDESDANKQKYMEYIHNYGSFSDFPYELAKTELQKYYPEAFDETVPAEKRVLFARW